jgi:hypothetical protein
MRIQAGRDYEEIWNGKPVGFSIHLREDKFWLFLFIAMGLRKSTQTRVENNKVFQEEGLKIAKALTVVIESI